MRAFILEFSADRSRLIATDEETDTTILAVVIVGVVHDERADRIAKIAGALVTECFEGTKHTLEHVGPKAS